MASTLGPARARPLALCARSPGAAEGGSGQLTDGGKERDRAVEGGCGRDRALQSSCLQLCSCDSASFDSASCPVSVTFATGFSVGKVGCNEGKVNR